MLNMSIFLTFIKKFLLRLFLHLTTEKFSSCRKAISYNVSPMTKIPISLDGEFDCRCVKSVKSLIEQCGTHGS